MNENMKTVLFFAGIVLVLWFVIAASNNHDEKVSEAAGRYEACIKLQNGMSPSEYYNRNGIYPDCER